jgi:hypothetical protein
MHWTVHKHWLGHTEVSMCLRYWFYVLFAQVTELLWNLLELAPAAAAAAISNSNPGTPQGSSEAALLLGGCKDEVQSSNQQLQLDHQQQQQGEVGSVGMKLHQQTTSEGNPEEVASRIAVFLETQQHGQAEEKVVAEQEGKQRAGLDEDVCSSSKSGCSTFVGGLVASLTMLLQQLLLRADSRQASRPRGRKGELRSKGDGVSFTLAESSCSLPAAYWQYAGVPKSTR